MNWLRRDNDEIRIDTIRSAIGDVATADIFGHGFTEKRSRRRFPARWPVSMIPSGGAFVIETVTENVSSGGFYCVSSEVFVPGDQFEARIEMPPFSGGASQVYLICQIVVVRVEAGKARGYGIGCRIEGYQIIRG